jgi:hypothetical protein
MKMKKKQVLGLRKFGSNPLGETGRKTAVQM